MDGTLIDFADAPARVRLDRALPGLVEALHQSSGGAVALITGRSIADVDRLFPARRSGVRRTNTSLVRDASRNPTGWRGSFRHAPSHTVTEGLPLPFVGTQGDVYAPTRFGGR